MQPGVNQLVKVYVAQKRKISEGDKLAGRHGNKGVISKICPKRTCLHGRRNTRRHHLEPLGVPSRMNVGQVLESHLGYAARYGWEGIAVNPAVGTSVTSTSRTPRRARTQDRPRTEPAVYVATPSFDGAHWTRPSEPRTSRPFSTPLRPSTSTARTASDCSPGTTTASDPVQRSHRRALRQPDLGGLRLHFETCPHGRRQDPRPFDRPYSMITPSRSRQGPVRWTAFR